MTIKRFFLMVTLLAFLANSLLDCGTFNFYCILFYSLILVFAEKDYNHAIAEKVDDSIEMLNHEKGDEISSKLNDIETTFAPLETDDCDEIEVDKEKTNKTSAKMK